MYYPDKRVRLRGSYLVKEPVPAYIIHAVNGSFHKSRADVQEADLQAGKQPGTPDWGVEPAEAQGILNLDLPVRQAGNNHKEYLAAPRGDYNQFYTHMYNAIRHNQPVPVAAEDAIAVVSIIEAAFLSSQQGKVIGS